MSWAKLPAELRQHILFEVIDTAIPDLAQFPKPSEAIAAYRAYDVYTKFPEGPRYWASRSREALLNLALVNSTLAMDLHQPIERARDRLQEDYEYWWSHSANVISEAESEEMSLDDYVIWTKSRIREREVGQAVMDEQSAVLKDFLKKIEKLQVERSIEQE